MINKLNSTIALCFFFFTCSEEEVVIQNNETNDWEIEGWNIVWQDEFDKDSLDAPFAVCDSSTVSESELIPTDLFNYLDGDDGFTVEIYQSSFNDNHQWYYYQNWRYCFEIPCCIKRYVHLFHRIENFTRYYNRS